MTRTGKGLLLAASTRDDELTALAGRPRRAPAARRQPAAPLLRPCRDARVRRRGRRRHRLARDGRGRPHLLAASVDGADADRAASTRARTRGSCTRFAPPPHFLDERPVMVHLGDALVSQPLPPLFDELDRSGADAMMLVRNAAELGGQAPVPGLAAAAARGGQAGAARRAGAGRRVRPRPGGDRRHPRAAGRGRHHGDRARDRRRPAPGSRRAS